MGMFSRLSDIVQANLNAMLDKAEDPEKIVRLIIQEMEETMVELRSVAAKYLAEKKQLEREFANAGKQAEQWQAKASLAIEKDKESLARAALVEKQSFVQKQQDIQKQLDELEEALNRLQNDTAALAEKLTEAKAKQKAIVVRKSSASVRLKAKQVEHSDKLASAMSRFDEYEQRIEGLEAQVDAYDVVPGSAASDLESQFKALEADDAIEAELAALKLAKQPKQKKKAA